jgi:ABC-type uncharacterized transport system permease subunit
MMNVFFNILQISLPVLYGVSALCYLCYFFRKNSSQRNIGTSVLVTAAVAHMVYTVVLGGTTGRHPMGTIYEFLSFVAMTMGFIYLFLEIWHRNAYIGTFTVPAIFLLQFCSTLGIEPSVTLKPLLHETRFALHATTFAAAYASFFLGVIFALMVLLFERSIRRHRFGIIFEQLPSLDVLARMTATTLVIGFVFMSIGLSLGAWNALETSAEVGVDVKVLLTLLVWLLYGAAIVTRFVFHWSDKSLAIFCMSGFLLLITTTVYTHVSDAGWHHFVG